MKPDGTFVFYEPLKRSPYKGSGWVVVYFDDGIKINVLSKMKNGKKDGFTTYWYNNGQMMAEANYKDDKKDGLFTYWYDDGGKRADESYKDGKLHGPRITFYKSGQKEKK